MEYRYLGRSGLMVSNICLGTMTFGKAETGPIVYTGPTNTNMEQSHEILDRYLELGGNFIDTADVYTWGQSETIIGQWLAKNGKRNDIVLATKVRNITGKQPNDIGLTRRHIIKACEGSLNRLQTNYIDLYQTHVWDAATPLEETMRTLDDLVRCGKVHYVGVSNVCGWQLQKIVDLSKSMGLNPVVSLQQQYSLLCRQPELEEFQVCKNEGLAILPWSPLKAGLLTGKYKRDSKPDMSQGRVGAVAENEKMALANAPAWSQYGNDEGYWKLRENLEQIGKEYGKSESQVAIRWLLQKDIVPSVVVGCTSTKQLEENCAAASGWKLTKQQMEVFDELSAVKKSYPYDFIDNKNATRNNIFCPPASVSNVP